MYHADLLRFFTKMILTQEGSMKAKTTLMLVVACCACLQLGATNFFIEKHANGTCTILGYDGTEPHVVIPEKIQGYRVTTIGEGMFGDSESLLSIAFPSTLTTIERFALFWYHELESIARPAQVTSIGEQPFLGCTKLS
jgi:hypothetical protein